MIGIVDMIRDRTALALGALAVLQFLHLLDDLRTDPEADVAGIFLRPQPILGIGGTVAAIVAVRRGAPIGRPLALLAAGVVALGFIVSHGSPVEVGPTKPYWGDGSADALQWLGVSLILACCAYIAVFARRLHKEPA
jgi:peptidoglycan/LPS O-acetylase OafA/YrhL